jgi:anti-sigma regulatory factor (Ser/Thr protein kinase)
MIRPFFRSVPTQPPVSVPATSDGLREAVLALERFCSAEALPPEVAWRLRVALDEVLSNIVRHGNGARVEVSFHREADLVEIVVADDGAPFDPLAWPAPDVRASLEVRQPGGLGIALLKGLIEDIHYERLDRNVLTMRTKVRSPRGKQREN